MLYAIKTDKGYLANQGGTTWHESRPVGWCLYSSKEHAKTVAEQYANTAYEIVPVK